MSRLRANQITNENANGAPNFPHGLTVTGIITATTNSTSIIVGSAVTANSQGIDVTGIVTATSFKGAATNLTSIPAANLTGVLPAISGANLTGVGGGLQSQQVFTSNGTWTKPSGITKVKVYVTGGGGGGSGVGGNQYDDGGQGGAAGGTAIKIIDVSSISSVTVTVGAAGQASGTQAADGGDGGTSSFGSHCTATGGQGGRSGTSNVAQAVPGLGASGDINLYGGTCATSGAFLNLLNNTQNHVSLFGFVGGSSFWGGGPSAAWWTTGAFGQATKPGHGAGAPGSGGGGGSGAANPGGGHGANVAGGGTHGKAGIVVVEQYK